MQQGTTRGTTSERVRLRVLYDFEYETRGKRVRIIKDERLVLLHKTNDDWWQVVRPADLVGSSNFFVPEQITFYVPTGYVVEAPPEDILPESTRFYVDKDKMFSKSPPTSSSTVLPNDQQQQQHHGTVSSSCSSSSNNSSISGGNATTAQQHSSSDEPNKEPSSSSTRKAHDSFRSVMKKLSGNLTGSSHGSDVNKSKPPKVVKSQRKKSVDNSTEETSSSATSSGGVAGGRSILGALVPSAKHKDGSAFGMCFGRDMKNTAADAQLLNPFQEELANKVILKKTIVLDAKVDNTVGNNNNNNNNNCSSSSGKHVDQVEEPEQSSSFENIHSKWEKVSGHIFKNKLHPEIVPKRPNAATADSNFQFVSLAKIKEDAQKRRSASPNLQGSTNSSSSNNNNNNSNTNSNNSNNNNNAVEVKQQSVTTVIGSVVDSKGPRKLSRSLPDQKSTSALGKSVAAVVRAADTGEPEKSPCADKPVDNAPATVPEKPVPSKDQDKESPSKDKDRLLINDKRKMWAIETLMSELMQSSSSNSKAAARNGSDEEKGVSGPCQLAQELHEMNNSRRFENAEIQVNLLDPELESQSHNNNNNNIDKDEQQSTKDNEHHTAVNAYKRNKVFHFPPPPRSSMIKAPKSPTARSPKLLDEYNEANILNDNEKTSRSQQQQQQQQQQRHRHQQTDEEPPSYSNISLRVRRDRVPCALKMPSKDFREKIQLTPSLEKLASEIKFLPANAAADAERQQSGLDLDCPTTTLSQDSLRLYKRRSKSDGALNKRDPRRRDSVDRVPRRNPSSASHMEIFAPSQGGQRVAREAPLVVERKYARCSLVVRQEPVQDGRAERSRYSKLERKSRSLGDLDCSDEKKEDEADSRRRYKPVPKLRSKESLRRIKQSAPDLTPAASTERLIGRPIPAKRRIQPQSAHQPAMCDSSLDELSEIDIERSTAIGFKTLLRTSDSGSEEFLQYKTFPASGKAQLPQQQQQQHSTPKHHNISLSDGNVNDLSRSLSDEMILSSTSCSSASPSRVRDSSLENLIDLPPGWTQSYDHIAKRVCFVNEQGDKWFSSNDEEGKIYFFEENSNESSWALPSVTTENRVRTISNGDWPQLFDGNMCILKEGVINKTKITTENGKKLRKAWSTSYAVLSELFLLFFKDAKTYAAMKMDPLAAAKPDISIDLNGAFIEPGEKLSNRKNVYLINTLLGLQVLIQCDNALVIAEWYREIYDAIQRLPFSQEYGRFSSSRE